jgi:hypothetical protein
LLLAAAGPCTLNDDDDNGLQAYAVNPDLLSVAVDIFGIDFAI